MNIHFQCQISCSEPVSVFCSDRQTQTRLLLFSLLYRFDSKIPSTVYRYSTAQVLGYSPVILLWVLRVCSLVRTFFLQDCQTYEHIYIIYKNITYNYISNTIYNISTCIIYNTLHADHIHIQYKYVYRYVTHM